MDEHGYADLVAPYQMLPGPTSSQVGIGIGLTKAGYAGAFAAWLGFTAPSPPSPCSASWKLPPWLVVVLGALVGWAGQNRERLAPLDDPVVVLGALAGWAGEALIG